MMAALLELEEIGTRMAGFVARGHEPQVRPPLERLQAAAEKVGKAWSGSWLGHHAYVYYAGLQSPPPGAHFSAEWGFDPLPSAGTVGEWHEFDPEDVKGAIREMAGDPDTGPANDLRDELVAEFESAHMDVLSILGPLAADPFVRRVSDSLDKMRVADRAAILRGLQPQRPLTTRDSIAAGQGLRTPPHLSVLSEVLAVSAALRAAEELGKFARQAARHLRRRPQPQVAGDHVFIGHGRSPLWRELKDFLHERLGLSVDEFNRVPVAGVAHTDRLAEMMDSAAMALIVMTAEDEQQDGAFRPRMNVVHEAGLFQGRLGFRRAIVVLEEGCEEFSNIHGLAQIRFPRGNIKAAFEDIRRVLERERLVAE